MMPLVSFKDPAKKMEVFAFPPLIEKSASETCPFWKARSCQSVFTALFRQSVPAARKSNWSSIYAIASASSLNEDPTALTAASRNSSIYWEEFNQSLLLVGSLEPWLIFTENSDLPSLPVLVVIITTPLAPRAPYIAADEASLRISIDSISLGLIERSGLVGAPLFDSSPL